MRHYFPIVLVFLLFGGAFLFLLLNRNEPHKTTVPQSPELTLPLPSESSLSSLAQAPDWSELESFQGTVSKTQFEQDLTGIFALPQSWQSTITIEEGAAWVRHSSASDSGESKITFAKEDAPIEPLPPLDAMHIAIDPGHIGGEFAKLEQRSFQPFPHDPTKIPVQEGDLTLATAQHLKPLLEKLGAKVTLVRKTAEPVTNQRTEDFLPDFPDRAMAEKIFYRTAEIRARADLINNVIKPDLVLCLHYNADAWSDPENPWASRNHFHLLLNGAYLPNEVALHDQRLEMLRHLYRQSTRRALPLAQTISDVFLRETNLSSYQYRSSAPAIKVDATRPIFARNLLANRIYQAPTIYLEPYVMNHRETHQRVQLGDYDGFKEINGTPRRSLVREYAHTLMLAFAEHYSLQVTSP